MVERFRRKEDEKKRRLDLSLYSHNLTSQILSREGKYPLRAAIPESTLATFQKGSLENRDEYWKEKKPQATFGEQMVTWLGRGDVPGIARWVEKQKDMDAVTILQEVGLQSTPEQTKEDLQNPSVIRLIDTINRDLEKAGKDMLETKTLSEAEARSLIFYTHYLTDTSGRTAGELIDTVVKTASRESNGNATVTIAKLQNVAPLLQVAGEEGQYVLGALMVAKAHVVDSPDTVVQGDPHAALKPEEQRVLDFLKKHQEFADVEPLHAGEKYSVNKVFGELQPEPTSGHKYWVDEVPKDFAANVTPQQLHVLELRKPFYVAEDDGSFFPNREVFDPASVLEKEKHDQRYLRAEDLTNRDSGLFALAAASSETPGKQAALYKALGETVTRVHAANPQLLGEFLHAQDEASLYFFGDHEFVNAQSLLMQRMAPINAAYIQELKQQFPDVNMQDINDINTKLPQAQRDAIGDEFLNRQLPIHQEILGSIVGDPGRLIALDTTISEQYGMQDTINIGKTIAAWPERVKALQEVLGEEPLTLTLEQIRQIEFLAHSVDVATVIDWMQHGQPPEGSMIEPTTPPLAPMAPIFVEAAQPLPQASDFEQAETATIVESVVQEEKAPRMSAFHFFQQLEGVGNTIPRRQEFTNIDTNALWPFSSVSDDIAKFEIVDNTGKIALFIDRRDTHGKLVLENDRNTFFQFLLKPDSLSAVALQALRDKVGNSTLLAYVFETAPNPTEQSKLLKKLFSQIALMYGQHESLRADVITYFTSVDPAISPVNPENIQRLFGDEDAMHARLTELAIGLQGDQEFSMQDFADMSLYALPLNLEEIAGRMKLSHQLHEATELPAHAE